MSCRRMIFRVAAPNAAMPSLMRRSVFPSGVFRRSVNPAGSSWLSMSLRSKSTTETLISESTNSSPGIIEAAIRLTNPTAHHPATGEYAAPTNTSTGIPEDSTATAVPTTDPHVFWREHWDLDTRRPYYHQLQTNELTWEKPVGFNTRFNFYFDRIYEEYRSGHRAEEHLANPPPEVPRAEKVPKPAVIAEKPVDALATTDAEAKGEKPVAPFDDQPSQAPVAGRSFKDRLKDYGAPGFALYLIIHFTSLGCVFLIMYNGVDLSGIARSAGFDIASPAASGGGVAAVMIVAVAVNKMFNPLQLLLTIALAPKLVPVIRRTFVRFYSKS